MSRRQLPAEPHAQLGNESDLVLSEAVINLKAANGSFRSGLPDNRHSVLPRKSTSDYRG